MRFHFRASIKPFFENHVFRAVWSPFYPLKRPKNENGWQIFIYGSMLLNFFLVAPLTYSHHWLRGQSKVFRDTLVWGDGLSFWTAAWHLLSRSVLFSNPSAWWHFQLDSWSIVFSCIRHLCIMQMARLNERPSLGCVGGGGLLVWPAGIPCLDRSYSKILIMANPVFLNIRYLCIMQTAWLNEGLSLGCVCVRGVGRQRPVSLAHWVEPITFCPDRYLGHPPFFAVPHGGICWNQTIHSFNRAPIFKYISKSFHPVSAVTQPQLNSWPNM